MSASLFGAVRDLIQSWYRRDRVRVAPATGRLLGLQLGDQFVFESDTYVVQSRVVAERGSGRGVTYELDGSSGPAILQTRDPTDGWTVEAIMTTEFGEKSIFDDDITILRQSSVQRR